jgi:hypothetical protein
MSRLGVYACAPVSVLQFHVKRIEDAFDVTDRLYGIVLDAFRELCRWKSTHHDLSPPGNSLLTKIELQPIGLAYAFFDRDFLTLQQIFSITHWGVEEGIPGE